MASFEEEVRAELEQERLANEKAAKVPVNPVVEPAPIAQPSATAINPPPAPSTTPAPVDKPKDFYAEVNAEIEQERLASQQNPAAPAKPEEPKEPLYVTKFREYGPDKDDEDVKTSLDLLTPQERHDLLKSQPWAYTKFTPEQQEEDFEESRKVKPMSGEDIANIAGYLYGTGVEVVSSSAKALGDLGNLKIVAPIQQAIKNKSFLEVKGENEIVQAAQEKYDADARNLSGAIPAGIIGTTRMIQRMLGGKDLNSIANPIQRAIATLAPTDLEGIVGKPIPDPNAGQENRWRLVPSNTGIIPLDLVTIIAQAASDKDAGGIAFLDRINERLGIADQDQSRNRDHIRKLYDAEIGAEDWKASNGQKKLSPWSQVAFSDVGQQAILFRERSLLPSKEFIAEHDGISLEQAQEKRNRIAEANAEKATTELTKEWNRDYDQGMEFLGSLFLGDAAFGEAGLALGAGKISGRLLEKASTLGMTEREVSRYYDALQKLEKAKLIARQKDLSSPSWWGKSAEFVENKQNEVSAAGQTLFENLPEPVKAITPLAGKALAKIGLGGVGGGIGALLDPENPSVGMLQGLTLSTGLGVAPSVIRSVDRARRMIGAGEGKLFSEVAKSPESSLPARLIFNKTTGPVIDYLAENSTALFKSGVNLGALSAVTSTLNSDDPEEFNQAVADGFGMGMGFHLAHGIAGRIHGKDPAQDLKNRQKRDVEIFEAVKTASPATQGMLEQVTNYQTAIDRVDALVARSESNLAEAMGKEDPKQTKLAAEALKNAKALQNEVLRANVQTRNEYGRSFLSTYADMNRLANGSRRAGQPNISLEILSPEQITDLYVSENSRQGMTPDEIEAVRAQGASFAMEKGYFDRANNRAVINAKHILDRTTLFGESPSDALRHDGSHALDQIPEFQKLNEKTDKLLFTTEEKDLQGNVLKRTEGIYDDKALVDMYFNKYIGDRNLAEKIRFSEQLGLYNPETKQFNIPEIVKYMKSEVRAELSAGSLRSGLGKLMGAEATVANWVGMRQKQNLLARAIQSVTGLGGKPFSSSLLGIEYTPEVIAANKEAIKALADFNGRFDLNPEGTAGREMSEKEIRTNPVLRKRYGLSGGEFQTELKGVVRDAAGKIVKTPVRITNPTAAEGNWTFDEAGNRKQTRGYGQVPDEFQGVDIPAGGSLEVYRDFVYEPDGKTPVATKPNDLANLETERGNSIRQALTDAVYDDSTTRLAPFSADGLSWSGIMSKSQVQAIKSIPESILPLSIKEKILAFNDTMARGDGSTFDLDYAPRLGTGKKYKGRKSDIYHIIPVGFGFSKAGNFYLRTLSLNAAFRKLKARAKLMDGWLTPWDNDPNLFMKELQETYLNNTYEKRDGWLGLDPENPTEKTPLAEVKFGRFLDFMNMIGSDTPPNPQRATTPADPAARKRKTKAGTEEDNQGIDNLWRSHRLDAIVDIADTTEQTGRYRIDLDRVYKALMPAEETAPSQEERRQTPFDGITATYKPASGAELTSNLVASGTSLESFGKDTLAQLAESYGIELPKGAKRGEIIDAINERPIAKEPVTENAKSITRQYGEYPKGTKVVVVGQKSKDPLDTNIPVQFPDGKVEKFPISWLKSDATQGQGGNLAKLVKDQGRDAVNILLGEWDQNAVLNPDGTGIISVVDPRESMKKTKVPTRDFTEWLKGQDIEAILAAQGKEPVKPASDISFMPASKLDETYAKAIESGDMEEAQRLVDERAREAGVPIAYPLYRGIRKKLNEQGVMQTQGGRATLSFTDVPEVAKLYTHDREMFGGIKPSEYGDVKKVYLNLKNPLDLREYGTKVNLGDMIEGYTNYDFRPDAEVDPETTFTADDLKRLFTRFQKLENSTQFESDIQASDNQGLFRLKDFSEVRKAIEELIDDDDVDAPEKISDILNSIEVDTYALADNQWFIKGLKQKGYDGLIHKDTIEAGKDFFKNPSVAGKPIEEIKGIDAEDDFSHDTYRPFESSQIKLSDPATYDNEGKLIPLSQRFDTSKPDINFMPYSPELPKTEDGKVDWAGFKVKAQEIAKPLADLSPLGGVSFMPAQDIKMKPSDDGRTIVYQHDKKTTIKPPVKGIKTLSGEIVGMLEADRHNTLGDNMGGPMHPFLLSNQAIARLLDGRGFKPVWANMNSAFVTRAKNVIKNTTSGRALIQIMKEEAHISNRKFVTDVMSELDKKKESMPKDIVDSLHVILELGARNPATKLKEVTAAQKAFKDGDITQRQLNKVIKENQEAIDKYGPMVAFLAKLGSIKSKATKGNITAFNKSYNEHIKDYQKQGWYKKIADKYKDVKFADEAARFTFNQRGAAMKRLRGIAHAPDITKMLADSMDFKGGKNLDLVASVQLSKDPEAFAIYTGKDPKQEAKMSEQERYLRDQFMKNPKFKKHPSYDWMMLGPENADNFILDKPVDPLVLFPDYAKKHPNANVRNGSKETIVGTMKKSKIPLKIK